MRPDQPVGEAVAVAQRIAKRKAGGLAVLLHGFEELQESGEIGRDVVEARLDDGRLSIPDRRVAAGEWDGKPVIALVLLAVFLRKERPAAIALAQIFGQI